MTQGHFIVENNVQIEIDVWLFKKKSLAPTVFLIFGQLRCQVMNSVLQSWYSMGGRPPVTRRLITPTWHKRQADPRQKPWLGQARRVRCLDIHSTLDLVRFDTEPFYRGITRHSRDSRAAVTKTLDPVGVRHFASTSGIKQWTQCSKAGNAWRTASWDQAIQLNNIHLARTPVRPPKSQGWDQPVVLIRLKSIYIIYY